MADFSKATLPAKINATDRGSYFEPQFVLDGMDTAANLNELLQFILDNLGVSGEANTGSNLGAGQGVFASKSGVNLRFKSLVAGTNITLNADGNTITINAADGGAGLEQYEADPVAGPDTGCFLTCTETGATFARTGGAGQNTEATLTVPEGAIVRGVAVHFSAAQAPGNTFYLNVDYLGTGKAVNGSENSVMPPWATVASKPTGFTDIAPATNYVHSGTPLQVGIAQVNDNGTRVRVRYKITNYSQQAGANASILSMIFP